MDGMRTGLEHRLRRTERRIVEQHRHIRELTVELDRAAEAGRSAEVRTWLHRLEEALRAHFELEEDVVFPALHGMEPSQVAALERLVREHGEMLEQLRRVRDATSEAEQGTVSDGLPALRSQLSDHERREEALVKAVMSSHP
jgi:iron-sulfur cluster repair protein YtfE (RIC family)